MSEKEAPFIDQQITWLDVRYRKSAPHLDQVLQEQGKDAPANEPDRSQKED